MLRGRWTPSAIFESGQSIFILASLWIKSNSPCLSNVRCQQKGIDQLWFDSFLYSTEVSLCPCSSADIGNMVIGGWKEFSLFQNVDNAKGHFPLLLSLRATWNSCALAHKPNYRQGNYLTTNNIYRRRRRDYGKALLDGKMTPLNELVIACLDEALYYFGVVLDLIIRRWAFICAEGLSSALIGSRNCRILGRKKGFADWDLFSRLFFPLAGKGQQSTRGHGASD